MSKSVSYEVVEAAQSPLPKGFLQRLPQVFDQEGTTIYKKRNEIKIFCVEGRKICVKKYGIPPLINRWLYSLGWREPKAKRTYAYAQRILKAGFCTPKQYGYVLERCGGLLRTSFSVGEFVENVQPVEAHKQDPELVKAFARYTADLHAHGLMHRDYILNNVLFRYDKDGYHFTLIDINRFVFRAKPIRGFLQSVNLMQPFPEMKDLEFFVQEYIRACAAPASLLGEVKSCRRWRNRYSALKRLLKKLPGVRWWKSRSYRL